MSAAALAGESDLSRAVDELATVRRVLGVGGGAFEVTLSAPRVALRAGPGEFAQLLVSPDPFPLLRRPFSFSRADPGLGTVSFYLRVFGEGTRRLVQLQPGEELRVLGPLGRGFTLPPTPVRAVLVSGGLGAAPLPLLAERLVAQGSSVVWLNGAANAGQLYPPELLPAGLATVVVTTDDGSAGVAGPVTDALEEALTGSAAVYACGPNPMLAAVARLVAGREPRPTVEVSIEAPMGCGFGTCLGCAIPIREPGSPTAASIFGLCCRQGPVLDAGLVDWERLRLQPAHLE